MNPSATFPDHFSAVACGYHSSRPGYPQALIDWLAARVPTGGRVLDCAAGSGQLATPLGAALPNLVAFDASRAQLSQVRNADLRRIQCLAEQLPFREQAFSMVTAAQAVHWFDIPAFEREVKRVLLPGGILALIGYGLFTTDLDAVNELVDHYYRVTLRHHWPAQRRWIDREYAGLPISLPALTSPKFDFRLRWSTSQLLAYLQTWSATQRLRQAGGQAEFDHLAASVEAAVSGPGPDDLEIAWPVFTRMFASES